MDYYLTMLFKLLLSGLLGALIGLEREHLNRPAGLRTNILVCIGAALVQIVSIDIYYQYAGNPDPARLGAQVISGIGFLGAGTILREGSSIKGLTTAAGLWVVACIGLAIGNGSYAAGVLTAFLAFITLRLLKGVEDMVTRKRRFLDIEIQIDNKPGQIGSIGQILGDMGVNIHNIEFKNYGDEMLNLYLSLKLPSNIKKEDVVERFMKEKGIYSIDDSQ